MYFARRVALAPALREDISFRRQHVVDPAHTGTVKIFQRRTRSTRKCKEHLKMQKFIVPKTCVFGWVFAFLSALCSPLRHRQNSPENAAHPKSQIFAGKARYLRFRVCCVFRCVWRLPNIDRLILLKHKKWDDSPGSGGIKSDAM